MELKLGGNVKDIVAMMYVGAVYEKIPDISLKEIHEKLIYGGVSGNSVMYWKQDGTNVSFYSPKRLITTGYEAIIKMVKESAYIDGGLALNEELFRKFSHNCLAVIYYILDNKCTCAQSGLYIEDICKAFTNEEVACYTHESTYSHWKELMKVIQC